MAYTYKDIVTGKIRRTHGRFDGWTRPTGLVGARYAVFRTPKTSVLVPAYLLTKESREQIAALEAED